MLQLQWPLPAPPAVLEHTWDLSLHATTWVVVDANHDNDVDPNLQVDQLQKRPTCCCRPQILSKTRFLFGPNPWTNMS